MGVPYYLLFLSHLDKYAMSYFKKVVFFLFMTLLFSSCRKDKEGPSWDTKILTPIISTELKIKDLVDTSSFLSSDANNLVTIEYNEEFYRLENPLDSLIGLSIEPFSTIFTLDKLGLDDVSVSQSVLFNSLIPFPGNFTPSDSTPIQQALLNILQIGALPPINTSQDISNLLEEATLSQAFFEVKINNKTEFDLKNLTYSIKNVEDGLVLISRTVPIIQAMSEYSSQRINLADEIGDSPIKGELEISISGAEIAVPDDQLSSRFIYSHGIDFSASITDIKVKSAKAQFSEQEVINQEAPVDVNPGKTEKLTFARIENGTVNLTAFSTLPTDLSIVYAIPNLTQNGSEFVLSDVITNDFSQSVNKKDTNFLFDNYEFDLTLPNATPPRAFNSFLRRALGTISATEGVQELSLDDTLGVDVKITEISPSYVRGFVGREEYELSDTLDFQLAAGLEGELDFNNVTLELKVVNELGLDPRLTINNLQSMNSVTGATAIYTGNKGPFVISPATEFGQDFNAIGTTVSLSNAENLLSILPDKIIYDISIAINPDEDTLNPDFNDFLHSGASLISSIKVGVPFELGPSAKFSLMDTISFNQEDKIEVPEEFKDGTISILAQNGFPLDADIKLYFLNSEEEIVDSLSSEKVILAAKTDPQSGEVTEQTESKIDFNNISNSRVTQMVESPKVLFVAILATGGATDVKILDTYTMGIQLVGDFGYTLKSNF